MGIALHKFPNPESHAASLAARAWDDYYRSLKRPLLSSTDRDYEDYVHEVGHRQAAAYEEWAEAVSWIVFWESLAIRDRNGQTKYGKSSLPKNSEAESFDQRAAARLNKPQGTQLSFF